MRGDPRQAGVVPAVQPVGLAARNYGSLLPTKDNIRHEENGVSIRDRLRPPQRAIEPQFTIDPGLVHHRRIQSIVSQRVMELLEARIRMIPDMPEGLRRAHIDREYVGMLLQMCVALSVPSLQARLSDGSLGLVCSTDRYLGCPNFFDRDRAENWLQDHSSSEPHVALRYSTDKVAATTLKSNLFHGAKLSVIGTLRRDSNETLEIEPLIIGFPWLANPSEMDEFAIEYFGNSFYEHFVEDFDEFARVLDVPPAEGPEPMQFVSELAFKNCLATILGDSAPKDWGGETSDYFSSHLHLQGRRVSGAFVLKGPAKFAPMKLSHLGKNNDQILRLSREPGDVLFVQHCHDIGTDVRETLRAFAVQPSRPRRYCLIDGRDSLRLLRAFGMYERAVAESQSG